MNEERIYGCWTSSIRKSFLLCNPPGGLGRRMFLSQPPEDPALTPQLDDACVSSLWLITKAWGVDGERERRGIPYLARIKPQAMLPLL